MIIITKRNIAVVVVILIVAITVGWFIFSIRPVSAVSGAAPVVFSIGVGDGFREVGHDLFTAHLVRSATTFDLYALLGGRAFEFKPGFYRLSSSMSVEQIINVISGGGAGETTVTIPEGSNIYDIDRILSDALVIRAGDLIAAARAQNLEGHLFPDTYEFYTNENVEDAIRVITDGFNAKAAPLLASSSAGAAGTVSSTSEEKTLIIASLLEKEVRSQKDQELVAGIILKRLAIGMALNIDATVCYAKFQKDPTFAAHACSLTALDFKLDSPYNSYLYKGLPPTPIGNPGTSAITAALHPQSSSYLYYLSDPATGKTIFAKTLDEQNQNRVKYIESNK